MRNSDTFFRLNKIEDKVFISFDLYEENKYDKISCEALKLDAPKFIIPIGIEKIDGVTTVRYELPNSYVALNEYNTTITIDKILSLYNKIYKYLDECREWYLVPEGFCFDSKYVYVDANGQELLLLYVPDGEQNINLNQMKELFINLLEKCEESSGDKIQLQLYKYFYKPGFDLLDFKSTLNKFKDEVYNTSSETTKNLNRIVDDVKVEKDIKIDNDVKIEDVDTQYLEPEYENEEYLEPEYDKADYEAIDKQDELITDSSFRVNLQMDNILAEVGLASTSDEWVNPTEDRTLEIKEVREEDLRGAYYAKPSRTQLSQEEIEEMVNTICNVKGENTNREEVLTVNEPKLQDGNKVSLMDMGKEENVPNKNPGDSFYQNTDSTNKKRNILDNVFTSPKINKPSDSMYKSTGRTANLKVVNTHPRYDLPKIIKVEFIDGKFTIGRATRTGELTGANYEFGAEITPISRIHAQIDINEDTFFIRDLGSSNGTFLNGVKLEANKQYAIKDGDKIAFAIAFSKNSIEYLFEA